MVPSARRVPRTHGRIRRSRLRRGREDLYGLSRFRLNAAVTPSKQLVLPGAGAGRARRRRRRSGRPARRSRRRSICGWHSPTSATSTARVTVRAGRQELVFGEQRLVGHVSWLNAARTFDGVKVTFRGRRRSQVDVFGASVVRILDGEFDKSGNGNRFAGAYATTTTKLIPQAPSSRTSCSSATSSLRAETGGLGDLHETTAGVRIAGQAAGATRLRRRDGAAARIARHRRRQRVGRPLAAARDAARTRAAVRLTGEYNFASGDEDPADGVRGTFDQLYPTAARQVRPGRSDRLEEHPPRARRLRGHARSRACRSTTNYHSWWLAERRDALYNAGGALARAGRRRAPPTATSARRSTSRSPRADAAAAGRRRLRAHLPGAFLEGGHARRLLQPPLRHGHVRVPRGASEPTTRADSDETSRSRRSSSAAAATTAGALHGGSARRMGRRRLRRRLTGNDDDALRHHRAHRLRADRHGARARLLQEVRHRVDRLEGSLVGRHPRQALARREPGHAHADRHAARLDDGAGGIAGEADGHSVAAQPERPGDHAQQQAEDGRRPQAGGRSSRSPTRPRPRRAADLRDDVPAGHARDVDALLAGRPAASIRTRTSA